jgi:putative ABC transport system substrate-binding protein
MDRRGLLLGIAAAVAGASVATAQTPRVPRVAVLAPSTRQREEQTLMPFFDEMQVLGYVEGHTIEYDRAYAFDEPSRLDALAAEIVARKPDLVFAPPSPAAVAARRATSAIPIVFATATDPVASGLVASLAKPGGNATGITSVAESLAPKLMEILHEMLPKAKRLALVNEANDPRARIDGEALSRAAPAFGMTIIVGTVARASELRPTVMRLASQKADAIVTGTSLIFNLRNELIAIANGLRLPVAGHRSELADAGALFSYGASLADQLQKAARMADKVLKGASPSSLPVEQPTLFEFVVNQSAAARLGIKVPAPLLLRADRVIA